ncbi:glycosyltransferase family 2 protein [Ferruginibacter sp. SUN002]|uniref:glycosyltransferase family 2 protein n=1 Tax=Ferruginibacter sp. SUN002 TaxID=2937789 RepID=UPI003D366DCD
MQLSIIIVNYNVKQFLNNCLIAVEKAIRNIDAEIFVVDNNSTDGSKEFFNGKFPAVQFIWNKENIGFAKANNLVVEKASGKYILFLNPDTIVPEDCFEKCLAHIESQSITGALGVKMFDGKRNYLKESKRGNPTLWNAFCKMFGLTSIFPKSKLFAGYYLGHLSENKNNEVDILCGAFMFVRKDVLNTVGSFDEQFFMYGEDIDLSYRIKKSGFSNYYFSETSIVHFKGESTKAGDLNYVKNFYGAMNIFVKKHYSGGKYRLFSVFIHVAIWLRAIPLTIATIFKRK